MARNQVQEKSAPDSKRSKNLSLEVTLNSKRREDFPVEYAELKAAEKSLAKNARHFSGLSSACQPKVFIKTFGCQMNVRDAEVVCGLLKESGYKLTDAPDKADIILFNTCSVRQHAEDKVWSEIGRIAKIKGQPPKNGRQSGLSGTAPLIGVVGCMAQNYGQDVFRRSPEVDFVVGPSDIAKIPEIISKFVHRPSSIAPGSLCKVKIWETDGDSRPEGIYHTGFHQEKNHAYVVISEGCSNYCSYCVVPYVRGELRNRKQKEILKETEEAINKGITSITLLGQNVCAYGAEGKAEGREDRKGTAFIQLLEMVNQIKGLKEFGFITSHPRDASLGLFEAMAGLGKLKKYLHLPAQSGADRILKLMKRGYTRKFYLDLIDNYRKIVKNAILTTDIIVGFPSETEKDFLDTHNLVKDIEFDSAYIFKYSPRPHTEAAKLADTVEKEEKERRHRVILELQKEISKKKKC